MPRDRGRRTEDRGAGIEQRASNPWLPVLLLLFVGSGTAALIYEIVWFQLLQLVVGSSAISLGVLLGTFMGGMCLGSLFLPRVISSRHHPLRVYALLEIGIGLIGVLVLLAMPLVGRFYVAWAGDGLAGLLLRGAVAGVCLLPPTILMGATLPAVARWVETTPAGVRGSTSTAATSPARCSSACSRASPAARARRGDRDAGGGRQRRSRAVTIRWRQ